MKNIHENFAAIAVTGELYNSGKDVYDVLAAYLQLVIQSDNLKRFTCADITDRINKTNSFRINESIVKTALKRLKLKKESGYYVVEEGYLGPFDSDTLSDQTKKNRVVVERLFEFISKEKAIELSDEDKSDIEKQFYNIISNPEYDGTYSILIREYILNNELDDSFRYSISKIREGLLVYEGICFSPEIGSSGKWDIPLDIYLELEVLFFLTGYNGEIHKDLYRQLIDYVNEINNLSPKKETKLIRLFYTENVKTDIEVFFHTAESILDKNEIVDPSKSAMLYILNGATTKRDIQIKKVRFYNTLSSLGITKVSVDFCSDENMQYRTLSEEVYQDIVNSVDSEREEEYIRNCADRIEQINILRKGHNRNLKEARSILLTANGTLLKCAYLPNAFMEGDIPKAVNLDYLITRFWYKLNKGFGKGEMPKSVDIITRAQMVISTMIVSKVSSVYDEIKKKYDDGIITDGEVAGILSELRKVSKNPDEITSDKIEEQIAFLTDYELNTAIEELKREEIAREKDKETIIRLQAKLEESEQSRISEKQQRDEREQELEKRIIELENSNDHNQQINDELKNTIQYFVDRDRKMRLLIKKIVHGFVFVVGLCLLCGLLFFGCMYIFKLDGSYSGVISILLTILLWIVTPLKKIWKRFVSDCKLKREKRFQ